MAWSLAGAALLLALGQGVVQAATITVITDNPNIIADGQCSLIEAIVNANNDAATHADCAAGNGADTIVLPANANVMLSVVYGRTYGQFSSPVGLPPIASRITIEGNGAIISRQGGAPAFGLMAVRGNFPLGVGIPPRPGDLTLQSVTLSGGSSFGGLSNNGTANIENSIISGNTGVGVSNGGTLTIENSTISGNTASGVSNSGTLAIANSTISGNTANFNGGGVFNSGDRLTITNSTIRAIRPISAVAAYITRAAPTQAGALRSLTAPSPAIAPIGEAAAYLTPNTPRTASCTTDPCTVHME